jgi:hypothetical protein
MVINTVDLENTDTFIIIGYKIYGNTMELGFVESSMTQVGEIAGKAITCLIMYLMREVILVN